ncbi:MAG: hypothetical protein OYH77_03040 [Pseudomonadota bacterium]|nr:hypothetical protein [Pseudomonadota bacterium]
MKHGGVMLLAVNIILIFLTGGIWAAFLLIWLAIKYYEQKKEIKHLRMILMGRASGQAPQQQQPAHVHFHAAAQQPHHGQTAPQLQYVEQPQLKRIK